MPSEIPKQMLVISLDDIQGSPILKIEKEPHYWRDDRYFLTHHELPSLKKEEVCNDFKFCWHEGYWLFLLILIPRRIPLAGLLSIQEVNDYPVLRFDGEEYIYKPHREFVTQIPLPSLKMEETGHNERICQAVGKTIFEILLPSETPVAA